MIKEHFPEKTIKITNHDKPYITENLKRLRRRRQRVYQKEGKSEKYIELKNEFDYKLKLEAEKYQDKIQNEITQGNIKFLSCP